MLRIGICDNDAESRKELQRIVSLSLFSTTEYVFVHFENGYDCLKMCEQPGAQLDLLFLEINLPKINGLRVAQTLRKRAVPIDIIFITELKQFVYEGYAYHAYDFLVKPTSAKTIGKVLQRYVEERLSNRNEFLHVFVGGSMQEIRLDYVCYFESRKRKIAAVMQKKELEFYLTMDELASKLDTTQFIRCHRSYFVNVRCISEVQSQQILLSDGSCVPISRAYIKQIRDFFHVNEEEIS